MNCLLLEEQYFADFLPWSGESWLLHSPFWGGGWWHNTWVPLSTAPGARKLMAFSVSGRRRRSPLFILPVATRESSGCRELLRFLFKDLYWISSERELGEMIPRQHRKKSLQTRLPSPPLQQSSWKEPLTLKCPTCIMKPAWFFFSQKVHSPWTRQDSLYLSIRPAQCLLKGDKISRPSGKPGKGKAFVDPLGFQDGLEQFVSNETIKKELLYPPGKDRTWSKNESRLVLQDLWGKT